MTSEAFATRIQRINDRLKEIEIEQTQLEDDQHEKRADLLDEERTLEARLMELKDEAAEADVGIAESQAGEASDYERVPMVPDQAESTDTDRLENTG